MRELHALDDLLQKVFADIAWLKVPIALLTALMGYVLPTSTIQSAGLGCCVLIVLDTVTGFVAALVTGEKISSGRFGRVLVKFLAYGSVVLVVALICHSVPGTDSIQGFLASGVLACIAITEGISVLENTERMGISVPLGLDKWLRERMGTKGANDNGKDGKTTSLPPG